MVEPDYLFSSLEVILLQNQFPSDEAWPNEVGQLSSNFPELVEAAIQAITKIGHTRDLETALAIRDEIRRLPDSLVTEVLNQIILRLIIIDPLLCRWFVLDVFLHDANPDAKADVAERINLLIADLRSH